MQTNSAPLIDIGVNLTDKRLKKHFDRILAESREAGLEYLIVTGTSLEESEAALALCQEHPDYLVCTAGIHPHQASEFTRETRHALEALYREAAVCAVGETGLDFNRNFSTPAQQEFAFTQQLELACEHQLPLFIHERDAGQRMYEMLRHHRDDFGQAVIHCFTGERETLYRYLDLDLHIGITGWVCDERRGFALHPLLPEIPANRLLLETDAPYLLPRDLPAKPKSRANEPKVLRHICQRVAEIRGEDPQALARQTSCNARRLFRLSER